MPPRGYPDHAMRFQVHEDAAIGAPPSDGEVVHAEHAWGGRRLNHRGTDVREQGVAGNWHPERPQETATRLTAQGEGDMGEPVAQTVGPMGVGDRDAGQALGEDAAHAVGRIAEEAPCPEEQACRNPLPGKISQDAPVARMDPRRRLAAHRATGHVAARPRGQSNLCAVGGKGQKMESVRIRQQGVETHRQPPRQSRSVA